MTWRTWLFGKKEPVRKDPFTKTYLQAVKLAKRYLKLKEDCMDIQSRTQKLVEDGNKSKKQWDKLTDEQKKQLQALADGKLQHVQKEADAD